MSSASCSKSPKFPGALLPYTEGNRIMLTFIVDFCDNRYCSDKNLDLA